MSNKVCQSRGGVSREVRIVFIFCWHVCFSNWFRRIGKSMRGGRTFSGVVLIARGLYCVGQLIHNLCTGCLVRCLACSRHHGVCFAGPHVQDAFFNVVATRCVVHLFDVLGGCMAGGDGLRRAAVADLSFHTGPFGCGRLCVVRCFACIW